VAKSKSKGQKTHYNRIKEVLEEKQLSQTWLAEKLDMDFQTVTRYVNNNRQPTIARLFEIAKVLDVKVCSLLAQQ
jgi:transcriptional regulator with XRE-family HTH domain